MRTSTRRTGFTLVEILIVISIIAIIASIVLGGVIVVRKKANEAMANSYVSSLHGALKQYVQDTNKYPGREYPDGENAFPALFEALFGKKESEGGKGGPSAPYIEIKTKDVAVWDETEEKYRQATIEDMEDPSLKKYVMDPWDKPYVYHENASRPRQDYMRNAKADIYSVGADGIDQTIDGIKEGTDDIGSW